MIRYTLTGAVLLALLWVMPLYAQKPRSETDAAAIKRAENEFSGFSRNGWTGMGGDLMDMLAESWKNRLEETATGERAYVYAFGDGSSATPEEAYNMALEKARKQIAGPMVMYFQAWNMSKQGKKEITEEEAGIIRNAINDCQEKISQAYMRLNMEPGLVMTRQRRSNHEVHLRILHNQEALRRIARDIIVAELKARHGWSEEKSIRMLTHTH